MYKIFYKITEKKKKKEIHEKMKKNGGNRCLTETERNMRNQHRDQWTNPPSYVEIKYSSVTAISGCAVQSNRARRSDYASAYTTAAANYIFEDLQEIIEQRSMLIVPSDSSVTSSQLYLIILPLSFSLSRNEVFDFHSGNFNRIATNQGWWDLISTISPIIFPTLEIYSFDDISYCFQSFWI